MTIKVRGLQAFKRNMQKLVQEVEAFGEVDPVRAASCEHLNCEPVVVPITGDAAEKCRDCGTVRVKVEMAP